MAFDPAFAAAQSAWRDAADAVHAYSVRTLGFPDQRILNGWEGPLLTPELRGLLDMRDVAYARYVEADNARRAGVIDLQAAA